MIRKIIYAIGILILSVFLIWVNYLAIKDATIVREDVDGFGISFLVIELITLFGICIAILMARWEDIWSFIDKKDRKIKKYFELKKRVSSEGSLSMSSKEKEGGLSYVNQPYTYRRLR